MRGFCGLVCVLALAAAPVMAEPKLGDVLSAIEVHYNRLGTMRVEFAQTVDYRGGRRLHERGTLSLLRPQKMRWEYSQPEGKLLVGDGEILHMYSPNTNQVRPVRLDETGDLRAPLSFLLGRLNFRRQFRNLRFETVEGETLIVGEGRPGKDYYDRVEFTYDPEAYSLKRLRVFGRDGTLTTFAFAQEVTNLPLDERLFVFQAPADAEILEMPQTGGAQ